MIKASMDTTDGDFSSGFYLNHYPTEMDNDYDGTFFYVGYTQGDKIQMTNRFDLEIRLGNYTLSKDGIFYGNTKLF